MSSGDTVERVHDAATATPARRLNVRLAVAVGAAVLVSAVFTGVALLVRSETTWLRAIDQGAADALHAQVVGAPGLTTALIALQELTQPWRLYTVAGVVVVVLALRRSYRLATWLAVTCGTGWFLGYSLKLVVQRARPSFPDPVEIATGYSYPSGHALNSMVFGAVMVLLLDRVVPRRWRLAVWIGGALFVLAVGVDRVALGVHYVSDVLAGWTVGAGVVVATTVAFRTWKRAEASGARTDPAADRTADRTANRTPAPTAGLTPDPIADRTADRTPAPTAGRTPHPTSHPTAEPSADLGGDVPTGSEERAL